MASQKYYPTPFVTCEFPAASSHFDLWSDSASFRTHAIAQVAGAEFSFFLPRSWPQRRVVTPVPPLLSQLSAEIRERPQPFGRTVWRQLKKLPHWWECLLCSIAKLFHESCRRKLFAAALISPQFLAPKTRALSTEIHGLRKAPLNSERVH